MHRYTPSHIHRNTDAVLSSAGEEKKRKYNSAAEARQASFTHFVVYTDVVLGIEADLLLKRPSPKDKPQDGCAQTFRLQYFEQQIFAYVVLAPSGEAKLQ